MPQDDPNCSRTNSSCSDEVKAFFIEQLGLLQTRLSQLEQGVKFGWGDKMRCGFDQLDEQIRGIELKMDNAIAEQAELRSQVDQLREVEPQKLRLDF